MYAFTFKLILSFLCYLFIAISLLFIAFLPFSCYILIMNYILEFNDFYFGHKIDQTAKMQSDFKDHFHPNQYELLLFLDGDLEYVIENRIYYLAPYDMIFIKPGEHHYIRSIKPSRYDRMVLTFPTYSVPKIVKDTIKDKKTLFNIKNTKLLDLFLRFDDYYKDFDEINFKQLCLNELNTLLIHFNAFDVEESHSVILNSKVNQIITYLNEHVCDRLTIDDIAKHFYTSKSSLYKEFLTHVKVPIMQYFRHKKIMYAQELIKSGMNLTEVAYKCGYNDYSTFYRNYAKIIGRPPSSEN